MATAGLTQAFIDRQKWLDGISNAVQPALRKAFSETGPPGKMVKDLLNGVWLGHPLHPVITDVPIGAWTVTQVLDVMSFVAGEDDNLDRAADMALSLGVLAAVGAAVTGIVDWSDTNGSPRRMGMVHAMLNTVSLTLNVGSMGMRAGGRRNRGTARLLSLTAYGVSSAAAFIGGELVYNLGQAVNRNAWTEGPKDFKEIGVPVDFDDGKMHHVQVSGNDIVLVQDEDGVHGFGGICSHQGCGLWEGKLEGHVVTCQCHGSEFDITDGSNMHGPATAPVPSYEVHRQGDRLRLRERA
jgi:nitrite reductase/ring-hydroxylating ferredoxin subunit/uncharacterized membrane protein